MEKYTFGQPEERNRFKDHCNETSKWDTEKVANRGFKDTVVDDGLGKKSGDQVT